MYLGSRVFQNIKQSHRSLLSCVQNSNRFYSSSVLNKGDKDVVTSEKESQISEEFADHRPVANVPFGKNLFLGKIDPVSRLLVYGIFVTL